MKKDILTPGAFCAEYHNETASGRVTFTQRICRKFCDVYTRIDYDMLTGTQKDILKSEMATLAKDWQPYDKWDGAKVEIRL